MEGGADDRNHGDKTPKRKSGHPAQRQDPNTKGGQVPKLTPAEKLRRQLLRQEELAYSRYYAALAREAKRKKGSK